MTQIIGTVHLNGISDSEISKVFEFKAAHEDKFMFEFHMPPSNQPSHASNVSFVTIRWTTLQGLDLLNTFLKDLEKAPRASIF